MIDGLKRNHKRCPMLGARWTLTACLTDPERNSHNIGAVDRQGMATLQSRLKTIRQFRK